MSLIPWTELNWMSLVSPHLCWFWLICQPVPCICKQQEAEDVTKSNKCYPAQQYVCCELIRFLHKTDIIVFIIAGRIKVERLIEWQRFFTHDEIAQVQFHISTVIMSSYPFHTTPYIHATSPHPSIYEQTRRITQQIPPPSPSGFTAPAGLQNAHLSEFIAMRVCTSTIMIYAQEAGQRDWQTDRPT